MVMWVMKPYRVSFVCQRWQQNEVRPVNPGLLLTRQHKANNNCMLFWLTKSNFITCTKRTSFNRATRVTQKRHCEHIALYQFLSQQNISKKKAETKNIKRSLALAGTSRPLRSCFSSISIATPQIISTATQKPKVVIVTGPTAVGKTQISVLLAELLHGEIISADSVQVYEGLDVGSDKVTFAERKGIPHHLIDVLRPKDDFSAGDFFELAREATKNILKRGKTPIVVGGTGFYLRWFIHGKPKTPSSTPEGAAKVEDFIKKVKFEALAKNSQLSELDIWEVYAKAIEDLGDWESAQRLRSEVNNYYRLTRVLEILLMTGKPLADLNHSRQDPLDYDFRCFFLNRPRIDLYNRIGLRCEQMLQKGLLQEAQQLLAQGLKPNSNCATKSIGYRQALEFLETCNNNQQKPSPESLLQLLKEIQSKSRNLCHHQLSWFRDEPLFEWIDAAKEPHQVVAELQQKIASATHTGSQGRHGLLSPEEAKAMRGYIYKPQLLSDLHAIEQVLSQIRPRD